MEKAILGYVAVSHDDSDQGSQNQIFMVHDFHDFFNAAGTLPCSSARSAVMCALCLTLHRESVVTARKV
jgi:hypothetical protein